MGKFAEVCGGAVVRTPELGKGMKTMTNGCLSGVDSLLSRKSRGGAFGCCSCREICREERRI